MHSFSSIVPSVSSSSWLSHISVIAGTQPSSSICVSPLSSTPLPQISETGCAGVQPSSSICVSPLSSTPLPQISLSDIVGAQPSTLAVAIVPSVLSSALLSHVSGSDVVEIGAQPSSLAVAIVPSVLSPALLSHVSGIE